MTTAVAPGPVVAIGIGNVLLRDDGVGVRVICALRDLARDDASLLPPGTRLVDGGTLDLDLLHVVAGARAVLLVDGMDTGSAPGSVQVLHRDAITAAEGALHGSEGGGLGELLAMARLMGWLPEPVTLVGIQVAEVAFGGSLSPKVEAALPLAIEIARRELHGLDRQAALLAHRGTASGMRTGVTA